MRNAKAFNRKERGEKSQRSRMKSADRSQTKLLFRHFGVFAAQVPEESFCGSHASILRLFED
jgi:hypothetical protein